MHAEMRRRSAEPAAEEGFTVQKSRSRPRNRPGVVETQRSRHTARRAVDGPDGEGQGDQVGAEQQEGVLADEGLGGGGRGREVQLLGGVEEEVEGGGGLDEDV